VVERGVAAPAPVRRSPRFGAILLIIVAAALGLRLAYVVVIKDRPDGFYDAIYYQLQSEGLANGEGFSILRRDQPNADHPPMTALVLAPASWAFGLSEDELPQRLTMALLGAGVVGLIGLAGNRVAGRRVGLVAGAVAALYPNFFMNDGILMAETLSAACVAATVWCVYGAMQERSWRWIVALGVIGGIGMLTRAELALLIPAIVLPALLTRRDRPMAERVRGCVVVCVIAGVVVLPWVVRNLTTFEEPVLLSYGDGALLLGANCDTTYSGNLMGSWEDDCYAQVRPRRDLSVQAARQRDAALTYVGDHFDRLPAVMAVRVLRTWGIWRPFHQARLSTTEGRPIEAAWAGMAMYYVRLVLAVAGAVLMRRRRLVFWPLVVLAVFVTVMSAVSYGTIRFRIPAEVSIVVLASVTLVWLWERVSPIGGVRALGEEGVRSGGGHVEPPATGLDTRQTHEAS
jgi:4-amino-4-deoxy-L-arabinose transferase-like glycosyltransferase